MSEWVMVGAVLVSSLISGFVGVLVGAFYVGRQYGDLETRVKHNEKRLDDGQPRVRRVDTLAALQDVLRDELKSWKNEMRDQMEALAEADKERHERLNGQLENLVTHTQCERKRADG